MARVIQTDGAPGSFWEDRGDRHHAGLDLYAPPGSPVVAIEDGRVVFTGIFTSPSLVPYWNTTFQVIVAHGSGLFCRYAELGDLAVAAGDSIRGGDLVGHVGEVLNPALAGPGVPGYVRELMEAGRSSMLHLEVSTSPPGTDPGYRGGNWFTGEKPAGLVDPAPVLREIS
ncbi:MAG TPA: M23 family metallopeptidase [Methanomicrobiales archaeon]|nr:M23 family metallopeptidase [Methanomicrobiales archaeon]